jgi:PPOX class probable F420-dependent enzyme
MASTPHPTVHAHPFAALTRAREISLTTFRKTGAPIATPVWFALDGSVIYVETGPSAGKLKRIRHTPHVTVAPCTFSGNVTGPVIKGYARVITDATERARGRGAIARKYGWLRAGWYGLLDLLARLRRRPVVDMVYVAIEAVD